jgi:chloramphenicol 3-O-phosphotransferase
MRDGPQIAIPTLGASALRVLREMYESFAASADAGTNLIVDDVLWHPAAQAFAIAQFVHRDAWLVGVMRPIGIAASVKEPGQTAQRVGQLCSERLFTPTTSMTSGSTHRS